MKLNRRWLQLSTRMMFVLITIIAVIVAYFGRRMYSDYRYQMAVDEITELGGYFGANRPFGNEVKTTAGAKRVQLTSVDDEKLGRLLPHFVYLHDVDQLELLQSTISDSSLSRIGRLRQLKRLYLFETDVSGESLKMLADAAPDLDVRMEQPDPIAVGLAARKIYRHALTALAISHDGRSSAVGAGNGRVYCWSLDESGIPTGNPRELVAHTDWVFDLAFSPDGQAIVTCGGDNVIRMWSVPSFKLLREFRGHEDDVHRVAFAPDGRRLVSSSDDCTIRTWDVDTGEQQAVLIGHDDTIPALAVSPDGSLVASGSRDSTIRIWELQTGNLLRTMDDHEGDVMSVRFTSDNKIVSASYDGTSRVFSLDGTQLGELARQDDWIFDAVFDSDSQRAFTTGIAGHIAQWRAGQVVEERDCSGIGIVSRLAMHPSSGNLFATTVDGYLAVFDAQLRRLDCRATGIKDPEFNPILGSALQLESRL